MATKNHNPVTMTHYYFHVNRSLWARFKSVCAKKGYTMRRVLVMLVTAWVDKNE